MSYSAAYSPYAMYSVVANIDLCMTKESIGSLI